MLRDYVAKFQLYSALRCSILLGVVVLAGCGGSSPAAPQADDHVLTGTIEIAYSALNGDPVIQEVEALVDDQQVSHQSVVPGSDRAFLDVGATFQTAGSHRIAVRIVRQSGTSVQYFVYGGIAVYRLSDPNSVVSYAFGSSANYYTMKAGDRVEMVVNVP